MGWWVDPKVATGEAAEFASGDLVEAHFYVEEGSRRRLVMSGETKAGRVQDVTVMSAPFSPAGSVLSLEVSRCNCASSQFQFQ